LREVGILISVRPPAPQPTHSKALPVHNIRRTPGFTQTEYNEDTRYPGAFGYFAIARFLSNLVSNALRRKTVTGAGPKKKEKTKEETS
jgi:hypothetical protein